MSVIKQLDSKIVYKNKWMSVREDQIERANGELGIYGVVDKPHFVVVAPVQEGKIHLVQQYRYTVGGRYWELPQGAWEDNPQADPLELAQGELREETGLLARKMTYVGFQYVAYGFSSQGYHIFLATELEQGPRDLDEEESDLVADSMSIAAFEQMILSGEIKDASTVNAYGLIKMKGLL